jgi:pyridoxal 5-phosphate dependent beta-lyase
MHHLDSAAASRTSPATRLAAARHADREASTGAYVAEAEAAVVLDRARTSLAHLVGLPADGLAFVESATVALESLLTAWPLTPGDLVAVAPSEWGSNRSIFAARGLRLMELDTDKVGRVDLDSLSRTLRVTRPALVHLTQVAAHRALVQPIAEVLDVCRAVNVPVWVDAAQAIGHVDTAIGVDVIYGTGRKWLRGPRGVGWLGVSDRWWPALRVRHHVQADPDEPVVRALQSDEAHVAGRVGLGNAIDEFLAAGPEQVWQRLVAVGRRTREILAGIPGWAVVDPPDAGTAITALRPTRGHDVASARARLLQRYEILTTASSPARAPRDMNEPLLRISPHLDCSDEALLALRDALYVI